MTDLTAEQMIEKMQLALKQTRAEIQAQRRAERTIGSLLQETSAKAVRFLTQVKSLLS
jgi:hypothetical protein